MSSLAWIDRRSDREQRLSSNAELSFTWLDAWGSPPSFAAPTWSSPIFSCGATPIKESHDDISSANIPVLSSVLITVIFEA